MAKTNDSNAGAAPVQDTVKVWFLVTKHGAVIGECEHAEGKRMELPKPAAEEAEKQGLGKIAGVVL